MTGISDNSNNSKNMKLQTFIFSIHDFTNATLMDVSNLRNNDFNLLVPEQINLNLKPSSWISPTLLLLDSQNSMVTVGEEIYVFNLGWKLVRDRSHFCKFSMETKSLHPVTVENISRGIRLAACYDGNYYIYFYYYVQKFPLSVYLNIEIFNLRTQTTELYHSMPISHKQVRVQVLSFFYKGLLYSLEGDWDCKLSTFDPQSKTFSTYTIQELKRESYSPLRLLSPIPKLACTDNRGNIYIYHEMSRFVRFNVETKELVELSAISFTKSIPLRIGISLVYHEVSENEGNIFFMGGKALDNFVYSTSSKTWSKFYETDEGERLRFGSAIVTVCNNK